MTPAQSQRGLHLRIEEGAARPGDSSKNALGSCPYCEASMPMKATVCRSCRRTLPEIVILKTKIWCWLISLLTFFVLTTERFYRLQAGDILWLNFDPSPAKYLEWLIFDPGPFLLGFFMCVLALYSYLQRLLPLFYCGKQR